jgi:4a-hydroxytetrahydrobiopterin dehydratase
MAELLTDELISGFLEKHRRWEREGNSITATFEFEDFNESLGFVTRVGLKAERMFHHPDIEISWNKVKLTLSTHSEGGLTEKDTELATFCDDVGESR